MYLIMHPLDHSCMQCIQLQGNGKWVVLVLVLVLSLKEKTIQVLSWQEVEVEVRSKLVEMFKFVVCH